MQKYICKICGFEGKNKMSLSKHFTSIHNIKPINYYLQFISETKTIPKCGCGCNEDCKFVDIERGFTKYKQGHISRIKNNWGHNKTAIENSANTRRQQYKDGEREVWNKGLDITDPRVKKYSEKSLKENNPERALQISKTQKQQFKDGIRNNSGQNNPMFGKKHSIDAKDKMRMSRLDHMNRFLKINETKLEIEFKYILKKLNIDYEFQYRLKKYNYDFYLYKYNILIEVDSDFWHCNPKQYEKPLYECQQHTIEHDKIKNDWAIKNGYKLLRFWESDIKNNRLEVVKKLIKSLEN